MKTQIIQLEPHDDVISARDKMGWSQTSRIVLVWPEKSNILNHRLDLVLLARHSRSLGSQLALVTSNPDVKYYARQLGIPIYKALRQAQDSHWRMPFPRRSRNLRRSPPPDWEALKEKIEQKQNRWLNHRILYWSSFFCSIIALLALAIVILPGASIYLIPRTQLQEMTLPVQAGEKITTLNLAGSLPAHWTTIVVEGRDAISTTGTIKVPVIPASGNIQFRNLTEEPLTIPVGTLVSTLGADPIWFSTTKEGKVSAGIGKTVNIPIQAVKPGSSGNLPAGKIKAVAGPLGLRLSAINPSPTRQGVDESAPAPSNEDRDRLYDSLQASLRQTALQELQNRYMGGTIQDGLPILPSFEFAAIIDKSFSPANNSPAEQLQLSLRLEFKALEISPQDFQNLVTPLMDASLPEGYVVLPDTLSVTSLTEPKLSEDQTARWTISAERQIQAVIDSERVIQLATGLPIEKAHQRLLDNLPIAKAPVINPVPSWWSYTPFLSLRIDVMIEK